MRISRQTLISLITLLFSIVAILLYLVRATRFFRIPISVFNIIEILPTVVILTLLHLIFFIIGFFRKSGKKGYIGLDIAVFSVSFILLLATLTAGFTERIWHDTSKTTDDGRYEYRFEFVSYLWVS